MKKMENFSNYGDYRVYFSTISGDFWAVGCKDIFDQIL